MSLLDLYDTDAPRSRQQENWLRMLSAIPDAKRAFNDTVTPADEAVAADARTILGNAVQPKDWSAPTTYLERFRGALQRMCGATPPEELCYEWLTNTSVNGADRLQEWVLSQPGTPAWAQGIGTIEAAMSWADNPTEGVAHEYRE